MICFSRIPSRSYGPATLEVLSKVRKAQEDGLANILREVLSPQRHRVKGHALDSDTAYKRVEAFLARQGPTGTLGTKKAFETRYSKSPSLKNVVSHINEVELKIDEAMTPRNNLQELISSMFSGNKKVVFTDRAIDILTDGESKITTASLSSGEKQVLRILIEALYAETNTIMIDEPEISMHVDWQRELIPAMQSLNSTAQLILATHSPEIMAATSDDKIFRI